MLVATRISLVLMVAATACAAPDATTGDDDGTGGNAETVRRQCAAMTWTCSAPSAGAKQTICGQLYDLETGARLVGSTPATCTTPTSSGPCSLAIEAYDAIAFAENPGGAIPLAHGAVEIDGCGRYRIPDIDVTGAGPFVGISIDDAAERGIGGTTVPAAVATPKIAGATDAVEGWIARESTTAQWAASGGPALANGVYVPMFRAHMLTTPNTDPFEPQSGVTFSTSAPEMPSAVHDYYFAADAVERTTIDGEASVTGANGTVLVSGVNVFDGAIYTGAGGLADETNCRWSPHAGVGVPNVVFVEIYRPLSKVGQVCSL